MKYDGAWVRFELRPGLVTSLRQFIKTEQVRYVLIGSDGAGETRWVRHDDEDSRWFRGVLIG